MRHVSSSDVIAAAFFIGNFVCATQASALTIGTASSANCFPFSCNDSGKSSGQTIDYFQIYSQSSFSGKVAISSLSFFDVNYPSTAILSGNYNISLGVTASALGSSYPVSVSNTQTFFSGALAGGTFGSTFTIAGATYNYDPSAGNLVLEIVASDQPNVPNGSGNGYLDADASGLMTTRAYFITDKSAKNDVFGLVTGFNVSAVPLPASAPMFGAALLGLAGLGYAAKRKKAAVVA